LRLFADIPIRRPIPGFSGYSRAGVWHILVEGNEYDAPYTPETEPGVIRQATVKPRKPNKGPRIKAAVDLEAKALARKAASRKAVEAKRAKRAKREAE
jgi:hypothetical protein